MSIKLYVQAFRDGLRHGDLGYMSADLSVVARGMKKMDTPYVQKRLAENSEKVMGIAGKYKGKGLKKTLFQLGKFWEESWMGTP